MSSAGLSLQPQLASQSGSWQQFDWHLLLSDYVWVTISCADSLIRFADEVGVSKTDGKDQTALLAYLRRYRPSPNIRTCAGISSNGDDSFVASQRSEAA